MEVLLAGLAWLLAPGNWEGPGGIPHRAFEHVSICIEVIVLACAIALPIGLYIGHTRRGEFLAVSVANVGRALPSFGILAFVFPFALRYLPGIAFWPTFIALLLLSIPPLLTNTYVGVQVVDPDTVEAARGTGMSERQVLLRLELPLAAPLIVAGLRTAAVQVVATATLGAVIGGGGLGRFIDDGFGSRDTGKLVGGAILVALLAILTELGLGTLEQAVTPRTASRGGKDGSPPPPVDAVAEETGSNNDGGYRSEERGETMQRLRRWAIGAALIALALVVGACRGGENGRTKGTITVGAVTFAENQIVAEMYAQVLAAAGYKVEKTLNIGRREILQPALQKGDIDVAPEYLGTLLVYLDPNAAPSGDPEQVVGPLSKALEAKGLVLLQYSQANDTNAFVVTKATAETYGLKKVSDLKGVAAKLTLGGPPECPERPFCLPGLERTYGIQGLEFQPIGACNTATAQALEAGKIDIALLCSTQSIIADKGWVVLEDDKNLQKADNIAPVVAKKVLNPEIERLLNGVSSKLTTEGITKLNARVELRREDPAEVARDFLKENGLL